MPRKQSRLRAAEQAGQDTSGNLGVDDARRELEPYLAGCLRTLGMLGAATTKDGQESPGDPKAASLAIEVWLKTATGTSGQAERIFKEIRELREAALAKVNSKHRPPAD